MHGSPFFVVSSTEHRGYGIHKIVKSSPSDAEMTLVFFEEFAKESGTGCRLSFENKSKLALLNIKLPNETSNNKNIGFDFMRLGTSCTS